MKKNDIVDTLIRAECKIDMLIDLVDAKISDDKPIKYGSMCGILETLQSVKGSLSESHERLLMDDIRRGRGTHGAERLTASAEK